MIQEHCVVFLVVLVAHVGRDVCELILDETAARYLVERSLCIVL
jgi:hypothetical protein